MCNRKLTIATFFRTESTKKKPNLICIIVEDIGALFHYDTKMAISFNMLTPGPIKNIKTQLVNKSRG